MKSIEEIRKEIEFAIESKKIDGFIENDSFLVLCPRGTAAVYYILSGILFLIFLLVLYIYFGFDFYSLYLKIFVLCFILIILFPYFFINDFLVYDYNNNQFYIITKFYNITLGKLFYIPTSNIVEIGINNKYNPVKKNGLFEKKDYNIILDKDYSSNMVYLDRNGKIRNFTEKIINKIEPKNKLILDNFINYCQLIGNLLEIPTKICKNNEKLEVVREDILNHSLKIIPIDVKKDESDTRKFRIKLGILQFFLNIFGMLLVLEGFLIKEYGFQNSFKVLYKILYLFVTDFLPRKLGLK